jgi:tetratricopeptide (TPR) repeat protein
MIQNPSEPMDDMNDSYPESITNLNVSDSTAKNYLTKGIECMNRGSYDEALSLLQRCLKALKKHPCGYMESLVHTKIAEVYRHQGLHHEALEMNRKALDILQTRSVAEADEIKGKICNDIAAELFKETHYDEALTMYQKALQAYQKSPDKTNEHIIADVYRCIGSTYMSLELYEEALETFEKALDILPLEDALTATVYFEMAATYKRQGEYEKSLKKYKQAHEISRNVLGEDHPETEAAAYEIGLFRNI